MSRRRTGGGIGFNRHSSVSVPLDPEMAAQLDQAMIAFGLNSRQEVTSLALRAWLAANMENATIHYAVQLALKEAREHEFASLADYYKKRAMEFTPNGVT